MPWPEWTPIDYLRAEIKDKKRIIDFWNGKKSQAEMHITKNEAKILEIMQKINDLDPITEEKKQ